MRRLVVGVLALQGAFAKHEEMLKSMGVDPIEIRKPEELENCDALIIPGGESTTMVRQIHFINLVNALRAFAEKKPIFGTCAGLILMSKEVISGGIKPFGLLDVSVERNAFGRQAESFGIEIQLELDPNKPQPFHAVFIRAPRIRECASNVKVLASYKDEPILVQQGMHLGGDVPSRIDRGYRHSCLFPGANQSKEKGMKDECKYEGCRMKFKQGLPCRGL